MSSRTGLGLLGALAAAALSIGCQLIYGLDDFESGKDRAGAGGAGEGGAGAAAGAGGGSSCACSPPIPQGWSGPFRVSTHPPDQSGAPCGDGSAANELLEAPPQASCTACACEIATACTAPTVTCYSTSSCSGTGEVFSSDFDGTSCVYLAAAAVVPYGSCVVNAPPGPGSCTPSGGEPVLGAWGNGVSMCNAALPGGACGGGGACIAPGSGDAQLCIAIDTTIACPPGWTEATMTAYRDAPSAPPPCSPCACGAPAGASCADALKFHPATSCDSGAAAYAPAPGGCVSFSGIPTWAELVPPAGSSCPASGGQPQSGYDPGTPTTICCAAPPS